MTNPMNCNLLCYHDVKTFETYNAIRLLFIFQNFLLRPHPLSLLHRPRHSRALAFYDRNLIKCQPMFLADVISILGTGSIN